METTRQNSLEDINDLETPATVPGLSGADYVGILRRAARQRVGNVRYAADVALNLFERWLIAAGVDDFSMNEGTLETFQSDLESGRIRRKDRRKYGSIAQKAPVTVRALHNSAVDEDPAIQRPLLNRKTYGKLVRIAGLTAATRELLEYIEKSGQRAARNGRASRPMTQATRQGAISAVLTLLESVGVGGVESVTTDAVDGLMAASGDKDGHRRVVRMLHNAAPVFRIAVERGLIATNPTDTVPNDTFADQAERLFLTPDELAKVRDLETVDMNDWRCVRDRLVMLLFLDTALRLNELVAVRVDDIDVDGQGEYDLRVRSKTQKGDKATVVLPILFSETRELLEQYLRDVRPRFEGDSLLVTDHGGEATETSVAGAVKRVADRLDLRCYRSKRRPTPHALRRTFGMLNAAPLGLALSTHELAWRMRDSIRITFSVYVRDNPLLAKLRGAEYRQRSKAATSPERLRESLAALRAAGLPGKLTQKIEMWLDAQDQQVQVGPSGESTITDWMDESQAIAVLRRQWKTLPRKRLLRAHLRAQGGLQRSGPNGRVMYARQMVEALADGYQPIADHLSADELRMRAVREILSDFALLPLGSVKLVAAGDLPALSRAMAAYRARTASHAKTNTTIPPKLTQPTTDCSIQSVDNAA